MQSGLTAKAAHRGAVAPKSMAFGAAGALAVPERKVLCMYACIQSTAEARQKGFQSICAAQAAERNLACHCLRKCPASPAAKLKCVHVRERIEVSVLDRIEFCLSG